MDRKGIETGSEAQGKSALTDRSGVVSGNRVHFSRVKLATVSRSL